MQPIILWRDALIYLLMIAAIFFIGWARQNAHLRIAWQKVLQDKTAFGALIILLCFISIGILDSLHFQKPGEKSKVYLMF